MILIALGANLPGPHGTPSQTLEAAKAAMEAAGIHILKSARTIETAPVPVSDQPWYSNTVVSVKTALGALALLEALHTIERDFGRVRGERNAARLLDLDLIAYHDVVINEDDVFIPHPRLHERGFVLFPIQDIAPDWVHPVLNLSVFEMIERLLADQKPQNLQSSAA